MDRHLHCISPLPCSSQSTACGPRLSSVLISLAAVLDILYSGVPHYGGVFQWLRCHCVIQHSRIHHILRRVSALLRPVCLVKACKEDQVEEAEEADLFTDKAELDAIEWAQKAPMTVDEKLWLWVA